MIPLPSWIDQDAWQGFSDMRRQMKKPMTTRAETLILKSLYILRDAGHDPNEALDQSTNHCWADVYEPKQKEIRMAVGKEAEKTQEWLADRPTEMSSVDTVRAIKERTLEKLRRVS